ncbi:hypothetical protein NIES3974_29870 [Calothrix sp. NIES-3974]|nr:hypothetical protein NIES3974_29870 [Calothrix sp. NIES-3974]
MMGFLLGVFTRRKSIFSYFDVYLKCQINSNKKPANHLQQLKLPSRRNLLKQLNRIFVYSLWLQESLFCIITNILRFIYDFSKNIYIFYNYIFNQCIYILQLISEKIQFDNSLFYSLFTIDCKVCPEISYHHLQIDYNQVKKIYFPKRVGF